MEPASRALGADEIRRYGRHLSIPEVGPEGQERLAGSRVLLVGAGGLGSPAALYLAAAGVGRLGIVDHDVVDLSNLQRQILHDTASVGRSKLESAASRLEAVNPHVRVETFDTRLDASNAMEILDGWDIVVDGSDNFPTRYLVNDACVLSGIPFAYGAILRFEGQASLFGAPGGPCYRCLFSEPPPPGLVPTCAEAGVLGVLPGIVGAIQATETIKWLLGIGEGLAGAPAVDRCLAHGIPLVEHLARPRVSRLRDQPHGHESDRFTTVSAATNRPPVSPHRRSA